MDKKEISYQRATLICEDLNCEPWLWTCIRPQFEVANVLDRELWVIIGPSPGSPGSRCHLWTQCLSVNDRISQSCRPFFLDALYCLINTVITDAKWENTSPHVGVESTIPSNLQRTYFSIQLHICPKLVHERVVWKNVSNRGTFKCWQGNIRETNLYTKRACWTWLLCTLVV